MSQHKLNNVPPTNKSVGDIEDLLGNVRKAAKVKGESQLSFFVNGKRYAFDTIDPEKTVIEFLRENNLTGTKLGCAEGGCGACTVVMTCFDTFSKKLVHRPINSCLTTIAAAHGCAITTVEGLAKSRGALQKVLHPIQQTMSDQHASQCGFCTPGIIMSMYAMWMTHGNTLTTHAVEEGLDGNLCRCTGYRPITNALRGLADALGGEAGHQNESKEAHHDDHDHQDHHHHDHGHDHDHKCLGKNEITNICNRTGKPCAGTCHKNLKSIVPELNVEWAGQLEEQQAATFAKLPATGPSPLYLCGKHLGEEVEWFAPRSVEELCCVIRANQLLGRSIRLAMGNSERRVEKLFKRNHVYPLSLVTPANIPEMKSFSHDPSTNTVTLGCAAPIHDLEEFMKNLADTFEASPNSADHFKAMVPRAYANQMKWFAGRQVRNVASLGGNLVTASPISDLNALHMAAGAFLTIARFDEENGQLVTRQQPIMKGFFAGYRQTTLLPHEVVVNITIPLCQPFEFFFAFKQCRRKEDDIAIVNAAFRTSVTCDFSAIEECTAVFGGMGPMMKPAAHFSEVVKGKPLNIAAITELALGLRDELKLPPNVPGGMGEYRTALSGSFALKNFFQIIEHTVAMNRSLSEMSAADSLIPSPTDAASRIAELEAMLTDHRLLEATRHTTNNYSPIPPTGLQHKHHAVPLDYHKKGHTPDYSTIPFMGGVGASVKHVTADAQVSGEAKYVDDLPPMVGEVFAALVTSTHPRAKIVSISTARAEKEAHGFIAFYDHTHIPGYKIIGSILPDEDVFAVSDVYAVGQVIGIVIAKTPLGARESAALVEIQYSTEGVEAPCLTIDDAIARERFYKMAPAMPDENKMFLEKYPGKNEDPQAQPPDYDALIESMKARDDVLVVEGESFIGGQEHFYLETNQCRVSVAENQEITIESSNQHNGKAQALVSKVTGVSMHKVVCTVRRLGGGFGGKETRASFFAAYTSIAAINSGLPVRLVLDRDVDMQCSGQRNAFKAFYTVAINKKTLKLEAVKMRSYCSAGWSTDLSVPIAERCIFHSDGAYNAPYVKFEQYVCQTNISSNTAFRGFGGPQGFYFAETYIEHAARALGVPVEQVKAANLYRVNDVTPYGIPEAEDNLAEVVNRVKATSDFARRVAEVEAFNASSKYTKRGLAVTPVKFGMSFTKVFMNQGGALVHLYQDGTVLVSHGGIEMGQGLHTKVAQVAATSFNIPLSAVHVGTSATDKVANSMPTAASVGSDLYGAAAKIACDEIISKIRPYLESARSALLAKKGYQSMAEATPEEHKAVLANAAFSAHFDRVELSATALYKTPLPGWDWPTRTGRPFFYSSFGCAVAEVEVDTLTGDHTTIRVDALHDTGASINPACDIGQIEGAFVQGMGLFTIEELVRIPSTGALFTKGPGTYKIPAFADMPKDFRVEVLNKPTVADTVHKSKGVGEPPLLLGHSVAAALKEAVHANRSEFARTIAAMPNVNDEIKALVKEYASNYIRIDSPFTVEKVRTAMWDVVTAPMEAIIANDVDAVTKWLESTLKVVPAWNPQV